MLRISLLFWILTSASVSAQFQLQPAYPRVTGAAGDELPLAWLGGLNAPQFNASDLDGDGRDDLLLFDRAGDALLALRGDGAGNYTIAPELTVGFPGDLKHWLLLRDYDGDGADDLFTYSAEDDGFRVFRGQRGPSGLLTYAPEPTYAGLRYPLGSGNTTPIFVTSIDYPALDDLDGDGDLDILTFSVGGGYVEYYRNQSVERGFGTDTLLYTLESECWGGFFESGLTPELDLGDAPGECFTNLRGETPVKPRHAGSTILTLDADGNGLKDIMLGDISFEFLVLGLNTGTPQQAFITDQDPRWPTPGTTADIPFFPAAYHLDVDGDGARDIVASPSQTLNAEDINVSWYYQNVGTDASPDFVFRDSQLLVRQSIDLGTGALPAMVDYDADGRPDLVIGNSEDYGPRTTLNSRLRLYRNVTPPGGELAFSFADDDFLELRQYSATTSAFAPAFGDLDGDGDTDAIVGERSGRLIYLENTAGPGRATVFAAPVFEYMDIDAGQLAKPTLADLDRDGLTDLVVGGFDGRIRFYRNVGSVGAPAFDADPEAAGNYLQLGGINTNVPGSSTGHPTPQVVTYDDRFLLITGNRAGTLEAYSFTEPSPSFTLLNDTVAGLDVGGFSAPATADFDGDGLLDMVVGNQRGGVGYYRTDLVAERSTGLLTVPAPDFVFGVSPNPSSDVLRVYDLPGTQEQRINLYSNVGQLLRTVDAGGQLEYTLDLSLLTPGIYLVAVEGDAGRSVARFVMN
ncbi:FG-GAP-like repeat-containing protein [Lewinella sp. JB7]|uniref:FG-GAP-like repeat-containing protein n=1 Tax=Lewinella sp. JB7 TaxID=2962887 RepID=UPI0020C9736A|nr:FG-GAP-like repeat-containing protein [Lewinella sp. JB7]MCP9236150.1 T9SS type A sorting domain-containing protein [Lewinella sp. JB7]